MKIVAIVLYVFLIFSAGVCLFYCSELNGTCDDYPLPAWPFSLRENGERMRKWSGNGERMRKWREISLDFLIFSLFPPSLSISYIKIVICCRKMSKNYFCRKCHKKLNMRYEKIILGQILCEKAPQVVPACINSEWIWDLSDDRRW